MIIFLVLSIAGYILLLLLFSFGKTRLSKKWNQLLCFMLMLVCGYIGYHTIPYPMDDLSRYYQEVNLMREMRFEQAISVSTWSQTILSSIILYIASRVSDPHFLGFVTGVLTLFEFTWLTNICIKKVQTYRAYALLMCAIVFFGNVYLYESISIARFTFGSMFAIIVVTIDYSGKVKKPVMLFLYALLPFFHIAFFVIGGIRLLSLVKKRSVKYLIVALLSPLLVNLAANLMRITGISILVGFTDKINSVSSHGYLFSSLGRTLLYFGLLLLMFFVNSYAIKLQESSTERDQTIASQDTGITLRMSEYATFVNTLCIFTLISPFWNELVFQRMLQLAVSFSIPTILYVYQQSKHTKRMIITSFFLIALSTMNFVYQVVLFMRNWRFW